MRVMITAVLVGLGMTLATSALPAQAAPITPSPAVLTAAAELRPGTTTPGPSQQLVLRDLESRKPSRSDGEILMIVGGAGVLLGLLADEAIITIVGAVVGGYGLYVYLDADKRR
jgi:hypothetical protein